MKRMKNEKGITLLALVIVVIVLMSISIPVIVNTTNISKVSNYSKFKDDMESLIEFVQVAYNTDTSISSIGNKVTNMSVLSFLNGQQNGSKIKSENDNDIYYVINVDTLNDKSAYKLSKLNYGTNPYDGETSYDESDVYIINDQSWTIYYTKGVDYNGVTYYRIPDELTLSSKPVVPGVILTDFNNVWIDKNGDKATVPAGLGVSKVESEQTIKTGLVITDKFDSNGNSIGNEWVWIPCTIDETNDSIKYARTVWTKSGWSGNQTTADNGVTIKANGYNCTEILTIKEQKSIKEYKGFYIGRYEAGISTARTSNPDSSKMTMAYLGEVVEKKGPAYTYVTMAQANSLSEEIKEHYGYTTITATKLCSSYAWDTALKFIEKTDSTYPTNSTGDNYSGALKNTGLSTAKCNIYDMGGNVTEWTTEKSSKDASTHVVRGGDYGNTSNMPPAADRDFGGDTGSYAYLGFRPTLYL